jgi:glycosyltransferase involved in cell wall biosynthesis
METSLIILQTTTPDYRALFFERIHEVLGDKFKLYSGDRYFEPSIQSDDRINSIKVRNIFFLRRRFLLQLGISSLLFTNAVVVVELNPRILTNWLLLIIRRIFRKRTVVWGHAWPRQGKESKSDLLRHQMRKLASSIIVYTRQQKDELQLKMPEKHIKAAPNALFSEKQMGHHNGPEMPKHLIYVGRLSSEKKPYFLVKAFEACYKDLPKGTRLIVIGEGEERERIEDFVSKHEAKDRILILGHQSDFRQLQKWYGESLLSVSPGYLGLSVTQSFGFGVPMLISKNENHSPEIEAVKEGENAIFFQTDQQDDFCHQLRTIYADRALWVKKRPLIAQFCKERYSVEAMAQVFINLTN